MGGDAEPQAPTHAVGLFMVHGIGQQRQGDPLRGLTRAVLRAIPELPGEMRLTPELRSSRLRGEPPAQAELEIRNDHGRLTTWLLAESLWADEFHPPSTWATLSYLITQAPMLALARTVDAVASSFDQWWNHPLHWWRIVTATILAIVVQPLALLLLLCAAVLAVIRGLIPIESIKTAISRVESVLTRVLGDSVLFATDEASMQAMATKVQDDLATVRARCQSVVVIAHSQGSAVAVRALREGPPVDRLFTLGAGIGALEWLIRVPRWLSIPAAVAWLMALATSCFLIATVSCGIAPSCTPPSGIAAAVGMLGPIAVMFVISSVTGVIASLSPRNVFRVKSAPPQVGTWTDLHATADPVSGGASSEMVYGSGVTGRAVRNHNNFLRDHTSYLQNRLEVVDVIVADALTLTGSSALSQVADATRERSVGLAPLRHLNGRVLAGIRLAFLISSVFTVFAVWPAIQSTGAAWLASLPEAVASRIPERLVGVPMATVIGAAATALFLALQYGVLVLAFRVFEALEAEVAQGADVPVQVNSFRLGAMILAPAVLFLALVLHPVIPFRDDLGSFASAALGGAVQVAITAAVGIWLWKTSFLRKVHQRDSRIPAPRGRYAVVALTTASFAGVASATFGFRPWEGYWTALLVLGGSIALCALVDRLLISPSVRALLARPLPTSCLPPPRVRPSTTVFATLGVIALLPVEALVFYRVEGISRVVLSIGAAVAAAILALHVEPTGPGTRAWRLAPWLVVLLLSAVSCRTMSTL